MSSGVGTPSSPDAYEEGPVEDLICTSDFDDTDHEGGSDIVASLAAMLSTLVARNDHKVASGAADAPTAFHALQAPEICVTDYMLRIEKYLVRSPACFVAALAYLDRFFQRTPGFILSSLTFHRLILTCLRLATKFFDDKNYANSWWASVGGIELAEFNVLELDLLFHLGFDLDVPPAEFKRYTDAIKRTQPAKPTKSKAQTDFVPVQTQEPQSSDISSSPSTSHDDKISSRVVLKDPSSSLCREPWGSQFHLSSTDALVNNVA